MAIPITVHPHLRGAYFTESAVRYPPFWFIPTYVGHTTAFLTGAFTTPVHPHLRGAYHTGNGIFGCNDGSSPPTWGIPVSGALLHGFHLVHPHLRGAYGAMLPLDGEASGSSPPTWGIQSFPLSLRPGKRFIPTYVGHTNKFCAHSGLPPVHPHLRGAYYFLQYRSVL